MRGEFFRFVRRIFGSVRLFFELCVQFAGLCADLLVRAGVLPFRATIIRFTRAVCRFVRRIFRFVRTFFSPCGCFSSCASSLPVCADVLPFRALICRFVRAFFDPCGPFYWFLVFYDAFAA